MTSSHLAQQATPSADATLKAGMRATWASGDLDTFTHELIWEVGPVLVEACGIGPGQRVLDVAAGTGNVALRAAAAGASVVASDLAPEHFDAGRRRAREMGVEVDWREGDAEALPFEDAGFDVVTSCLGAMFAPDHAAVARELTRVCRPGGVVGMANFTPEGIAGDFFAAFVPYMPPGPAHAQPPLLWGSEAHVQELLGPRVASVETRRLTYVERAASPEAYVDFVLRTFGPAKTIRESLADQPERAAALDREFLDFVRRADSGSPGGGTELVYEYLLVVAHR